ncbi:MAG: phosphatase PAP2 family protein, partial [Planctomycetaceae bacterium]
QDRYLAHLESLRDGSRTVVTWRNAEGLITVPSFHTTWAILLSFAFRDWKWLLPPVMILNVCVVISTLTSGWHYGTDVAAGALVASVSVALVSGTTAWRYPEPAAD